MKRTTEQEAFLRADTLAEITRLSLDDLETQCVRGDLGANMRLWLTTEARPPSTGVYGGGERICTVCLAGATLVNRKWIGTEDQDALKERGRGLKQICRTANVADAHKISRRLYALNAMRALLLATLKN